MASTKIERKYLAHFIDASFGTGSATPNYIRLGADLEEYNLELNPDIEVSKKRNVSSRCWMVMSLPSIML